MKNTLPKYYVYNKQILKCYMCNKQIYRGIEETERFVCNHQLCTKCYEEICNYLQTRHDLSEQ